ncbi:hypothetical protein ACQY0O_006019 [Thecaphora frezii]
MQIKVSLAAVLAAVMVAPSAMAISQVSFRYTKNMVDVGGFDLNQLWWGDVFANLDNQGGLYDKTYQSTFEPCEYKGKTPRGTVSVEVSAHYGNIGRATGWDMRDTFARALKKGLDTNSGSTSYKLMRGCSGVSWQETRGPAPNGKAGCGYANSYEPSCKAWCKSEMAGCTQLQWARKLPHRVEITIRNERGVLLPDRLVMTITSNQGKPEATCGSAGATSSVVLGWIPVVGQYLSGVMSVFCSIVDAGSKRSEMLERDSSEWNTLELDAEQFNDLLAAKAEKDGDKNFVKLLPKKAAYNATAYEWAMHNIP